jgi:hypothetical protein
VRIGSEALTLGAAAVVLSLLLSGCSDQATAASSLATTSSNAAAAAQTASLSLRLRQSGRLIPGVSSTALGDALLNLQKADSTLTGSQEPRGVKTLSAQALALVRQAEDVTQKAQDALSSAHGSAAIGSLAERLHRISVSLSKVEKSAQAAS